MGVILSNIFKPAKKIQIFPIKLSKSIISSFGLINMSTSELSMLKLVANDP